MERNYFPTSILKDFQGVQLSEKILIGRNYFHSIEGKIDKYNKVYSYADLTDYSSKHYGKNIKSIRKKIAKELTHEYITDHWIKCLPVHPEDCESEAYILMCVSVDDTFKIKSIKNFILFEDGMPCPAIEVNQEMYNELTSLRKGKFMPKDFSFIGQKVTEELKSIFHLYNSGCDYSLHCNSGYRNVTTSFFIDVDENDTIVKYHFDTNENTLMCRRHISNDDEYEDVLDGLLLMYDRL